MAGIIILHTADRATLSDKKAVIAAKEAPCAILPTVICLSISEEDRNHAGRPDRTGRVGGGALPKHQIIHQHASQLANAGSEDHRIAKSKHTESTG